MSSKFDNTKYSNMSKAKGNNSMQSHISSISFSASKYGLNLNM